MLYATILNTPVNVDTNIPFSTVYLTNRNIVWSGTEAEIKVPGYYRVSVDLSGAGLAAGNIVPRLVLDGTASLTASGAATTTGADDYVNIAFNSIVKVEKSFSEIATLSVRLEGVGANFVSGNLIIERIA